MDIPSGSVVKNLPSSAGDAGSSLVQKTKIPYASGAAKPVPYNYWDPRAVMMLCIIIHRWAAHGR